MTILQDTLHHCELFSVTAKTRSDRDKLCHFWSKMKSQESQNKLFLFIASYVVHLILSVYPRNKKGHGNFIKKGTLSAR